MTHEQIIGNVVIALVGDVFLIVVGAVMQQPLKSLWERMNRPSLRAASLGTNRSRPLAGC
jgi:hypothetical protein